MKGIRVVLGAIIMLISFQTSFAGALFNVSNSYGVLTVNTTIPNHTYPAAGIKINTPGYSLSNAGDCSGISGEYCLFTVSDSAPKTISIAGPVGTVSIRLCLNGIGPLSCQDYNINIATGFAYIANFTNDTVSICSVDINGSLSNCRAEGDASFNGIKDIVLNNQANIAYVLNSANSTISICTIGPNGSIAAPCSVESPGVDLNYSGITLSNGILYLTDYGNSQLAICTVNADGSLITPCPTSTGNNTFDRPNARVAFNPGGSYMYVANYRGTNVSICPVNPNGTLGVCVTSTGNGTFQYPLGARLNTDGTVLYVANSSNNTVSICPINPDGSLGTCTTSTGNGTFDFSNNDVTNLFISGNHFGYIPNGGSAGNTLSVCPVLANGLFDVCTVTTNGTFNGVESAWLSLG